MAMTTTTSTSRSANLCSYSFYHHHHHINPTKEKVMLVGSTTCCFSTPYFLTSSNARLRKFVTVHASNSQREEETSSSVNDTITTNGVSQEDWNYLWKLGAGSIAGAALIKYGSILFPDITRPNIIQALIMISTPVVVAIVLLIKRSRQD